MNKLLKHSQLNCKKHSLHLSTVKILKIKHLKTLTPQLLETFTPHHLELLSTQKLETHTNQHLETLTTKQLKHSQLIS